uniref:Uncharacterized protein n=1 Tax=Ascaris lumbricoides TaxID=6252 RepID=A0A0M3I9D0_ASCLU
MKTKNHGIATASGRESLKFSKNIKEFAKLCKKFLADPGSLRELLAMQKRLEGMRQSCAFVDMAFRTLYDRRLYNRAVVQQTPLVLDHFRVNANDANTQLKLNDPTIAPFLWEQLNEWRSLQRSSPWHRRYRKCSCALKSTENRRTKYLAMIESLECDISSLEKIASLGADELEQLQLKLRKMNDPSSQLVLGSCEPSVSRASNRSLPPMPSPAGLHENSTSSDEQEGAEEFWSTVVRQGSSETGMCLKPTNPEQALCKLTSAKILDARRNVQASSTSHIPFTSPPRFLDVRFRPEADAVLVTSQQLFRKRRAPEV